MNPSLLLLGLGLLGSTGAAMMLWRGQTQEGRLQRRLDLLAPPRSAQGLAPQGLAPQGHGAAWAWLAHCLTTGEQDRREIQERLLASGYHGRISVAGYAAARLAGALVAMAAAGAIASLRGQTQTWIAIYAAAGGAAAFILAKSLLRSLAAAGTRSVGREIPFLLDMLLLLLESGISLDQCFRFLAQAKIGGMGRTHRAVEALVDDLQKGMAYDQALDRWAERLGIAGARELAGLFKQTLLHGSELGPSLREYAREYADRRLATARAGVGRQASVMTMVLVAFLMPAVMIMLAGPAVVAVKASLHQLRTQAAEVPPLPEPAVQPGGRK